uniref:Retrovirus-related Pol polyprotein from transposon TNT 1-94 n=1 Tax=Cajanus cajan TaxID=3821 RepID=A0A151TYN0_CAJCA|nr:hypothetical protein KK1_004704 [Cajanus cajan]
MEVFIKSTQHHLWRIINLGDIVVIKLENKYIQDDYNTLQLNTKSRYTLACSLFKIVYKKFCKCSITKEIWDAIKVTHEGTEDIKLKSYYTSSVDERVSESSNLS